MASPYLSRPMLLFLALPLLAHAWQTAPPPVGGCQIAGQVFGWDPLEQTLTLRSDSGHYSDFRYDGSTTFTDGDVITRPDNLGMLEGLNIDDRICVQAFRADGPRIASVVRVTSRAEIDARAERELVRWQGESLFGIVTSSDSANRRITVRVSPSSEVSVDAAGSVAFWKLPAEAEDPGDVIRGSWEALAAGESVYIRGERISGTGNMRANLVISGGLRSFAGSVESMEPLTSQFHLRDFLSGRSRVVRFDFNSIYVVGKTTLPGSQDRRLYSANIGALKEGDSVVILGRKSNRAESIDGFVMITGFAPGGIFQPGPGQSADWIFQAVGVGGTRQ